VIIINGQDRKWSRFELHMCRGEKKKNPLSSNHPFRAKFQPFDSTHHFYSFTQPPIDQSCAPNSHNSFSNSLLSSSSSSYYYYFFLFLLNYTATLFLSEMSISHLYPDLFIELYYNSLSLRNVHKPPLFGSFY
jgi:hypothetical protein